MNLTYIIGEPGAGKTTAITELTAGEFGSVVAQPFAHVEYGNGAIQLGKPRADFGGTDALSMSAQPKVLAWLESDRPAAVFGEGDRLANAKFFQAVKDLGYTLSVVLLTVPEDVAAARRAGRGSDQNDTWLKGRRSKVANLEPWVTHRDSANGSRTPAELAAALRAIPVLDLF